VSDMPFHLAELSICERGNRSSVKVPVWITQSNLDAIQSVITFCDGMERGGNGEIPGKFELVMFYRTLISCIQEAEAKAREQVLPTTHKDIV